MIDKLLTLIPRWALWACIAALATACLALKLSLGDAALEAEQAITAAGKANLEAANLRLDLADAKNKALAQANEFSNKVIEAQNESKKREALLKAAAESARAESDGLRSDTQALRSQLDQLSRDAVIERAAAIGAVLAQCSARYQVLAERSDRHVNDLRTLIEAWPKSATQ